MARQQSNYFEVLRLLGRQHAGEEEGDDYNNNIIDTTIHQK
jgi:hypothetical protein